MNNFRRIAIACTFMCMAILFTGCPPSKEAAKEAAPPKPAALFSVKILSLNLNRNKNIGSTADLRALADSIKRNDIDIVALQDISIPISASRPNYIKELAKLTDMQLALGTNRLPQLGEHGNAILSRLPILKSENIMLPSLKKNNDHGVLYGAVDLGTMRIILLSTHLDQAIGDRDEVRIADAFRKIERQFSDYRLFICATFFDDQSSPLLKTLFASYTDAAGANTYPADHPTKRYSYIFYPAQSSFRTDERRTFDTGISTYRAIISKLTYLGLPPGSQLK